MWCGVAEKTVAKLVTPQANGGVDAEFEDLLVRLRGEVEDRLAHYVASCPGCPSRLGEAMRYSLLADGKRLRPILVFLAAEACGADHAIALPAACAVEMIHTYSLIHDDLPAMDDDDLRRGRPTSHKRFGEATAILAGDALLTLAFEVLAEDVGPSKVAARCARELSRAAGRCGMVGGQADDVDAEGTEGNLDELESIHERKTGALLRASLRLGGLVADAEERKLEALDVYGRDLGLAFQITDDLLDVQGTSEQLGKRAQKDLEKKKLTYPGLLGIEASATRARGLCRQACEALAPFGEKAARLRQLTKLILERDR